MSLKCSHISKQFGRLKAVDALSFEVRNGEIFGIAGPNGAGKTTLFNMIAGLHIYSGSIDFNGRELNGLPAHRICQSGIARTFQTPQLFASLSVSDNIRAGAHFGSRRNKPETETLEEILDFVGLGAHRDHKAAHLKLLDKKLTMIGAALATHPQILLLDEPIAGLNSSEITQSLELFHRINQELGITILIIEHFMKVLTELSQQLLILENGKKVCLGPPHEVTRDPRVIECYLGDDHD